VEKTGRLVVAHQAHRTGGAGAEIAQQVMERAFDALDGPVARVAAQDVPVPASAELERAVFPAAADIVRACQSFRRR
jgi:pyruvate dehydrogenase E1 component beta subunit